MQCPKCRSMVPADDVNLDRLLGKCRQCHEVFRVDGLVGVPPRPEKLVVRDDGDGRRIFRSWFTPAYIGLLAFCIVWNGFLIIWYSKVLREGSPWFMAVVPIGHVAAGVLLTYWTLAGILNQTVVAVRGEWLTVRHEPLPWAGNRVLPQAEIKQLYCEETSGPWYDSWNRGRPAYNVHAVLADNRRVKLLSRLRDKGEALFYEHQLGRWLDVKPQPVASAVS